MHECHVCIPKHEEIKTPMVTSYKSNRILTSNAIHQYTRTPASFSRRFSVIQKKKCARIAQEVKLMMRIIR